MLVLLLDFLMVALASIFAGLKYSWETGTIVFLLATVFYFKK